jgi:GntR family transcriptional regulator
VSACLSTPVRYLELADALRDHIARLGPSALLPTEHQLARRFAVSRVTVRRALSVLERAGMVTRQRGRGTTVSPSKVVRTLLPVSTFETDMGAQKIAFETRLLDYQPSAPVPEAIRARLRIGPDEPVGLACLTRLVDDRTICFDQRYLSPVVAGQFDPALAATRPVSAILQQLSGREITALDWETQFTPAGPDVARALGITPGVLVVMNVSTEYLADGTPIQVGVTSYRVDCVTFRFTWSGAGPVYPADRDAPAE